MSPTFFSHRYCVVSRAVKLARDQLCWLLWQSKQYMEVVRSSGFGLGIRGFEADLPVVACGIVISCNLMFHRFTLYSCPLVASCWLSQKFIKLASSVVVTELGHMRNLPASSHPSFESYYKCWMVSGIKVFVKGGVRSHLQGRRRLVLQSFLSGQASVLAQHTPTRNGR